MANLPQANKGGDIPEITDGVKPAKFIDLVLKDHPDWATPKDKYGNPDDGKRYHFLFAILDKKGNPVPVVVDGEVQYEDGDPKELVIEALTRTATGENSNFAKHLDGILTAKEFKAWQNDEPLDSDTLAGRDVLVNVKHSDKGWPQIDQVLKAGD